MLVTCRGLPPRGGGDGTKDGTRRLLHRERLVEPGFLPAIRLFGACIPAPEPTPPGTPQLDAPGTETPMENEIRPRIPTSSAIVVPNRHKWLDFSAGRALSPFET